MNLFCTYNSTCNKYIGDCKNTFENGKCILKHVSSKGIFTCRATRVIKKQFYLQTQKIMLKYSSRWTHDVKRLDA